MEIKLPTLIGSEKQVKWALVIRNKLVLKLVHEKELGWLSDFRDLLNEFKIFLETETKAEIYIQNFQYIDISKLYSFLKNYIPVTQEEKEIEKEAKEENTIIPKNWNRRSSYEVIPISENIIKVIGEKDDLVKKYLKNKSFNWKGDGWYKVLFKEDNINDRICEIANNLLQRGWAVYTLYSLKEKIISANFKEELFIIKYNDKYVKIFWCGENDALYKASRNLPHSKWKEKGVIVNIAYYMEIFDFSDIYGFNISNEAEKILKEFQEKVNNPTIIKQRKREKLTITPDIILEDLKDE